MTGMNYDPKHPRDVASQQFTEKSHTEPDTSLVDVEANRALIASLPEGVVGYRLQGELWAPAHLMAEWYGVDKPAEDFIASMEIAGAFEGDDEDERPIPVRRDELDPTGDLTWLTGYTPEPEFDGFIEDEDIILSHANGDFDAAELGFDRVHILTSDADSRTHIEARTSFDLDALARMQGITSGEQGGWAHANRHAIAAAIAHVAPGVQLDVDADYDLVVDVTPADPSAEFGPAIQYARADSAQTTAAVINAPSFTALVNTALDEETGL